MGFQGKIAIDPSKPHRGGDDQKKKKYAGEKLQKLKFSSFFFSFCFSSFWQYRGAGSAPGLYPSRTEHLLVKKVLFLL